MYNGWTNYETWVVKLWIDNDQESQEYWLDQVEACKKDKVALADVLKSEYEEATPELEGVWGDLLGAAVGAVNWYEIAETLIEESGELRPEEEEEED